MFLDRRGGSVHYNLADRLLGTELASPDLQVLCIVVTKTELESLKGSIQQLMERVYLYLVSIKPESFFIGDVFCALVFL